MNQFLTRLYAVVTATLYTFAAGTRRRTLAGARGANFIEYAMLAVIAIGIGWIFRTQLSSAFNSILKSITGGLQSGGVQNTNG